MISPLGFDSPTRNRRTRTQRTTLVLTMIYFVSVDVLSAKPCAPTKITNATAAGAPSLTLGSGCERSANPIDGITGAKAIGHKWV